MLVSVCFGIKHLNWAWLSAGDCASDSNPLRHTPHFFDGQLVLVDSLQNDKHLRAVKLISHESHPTEGKTAALRSSIKVNNGYLDARFASQPKGWDSKSILSELGFTGEQVDNLLNAGSVIS